MPSLWAAGLLLRRLRNELGILTLICLLVAGTSFIFASVPRLFDRVSTDALQYAARVATPVQRNISLSLNASIAPGSNDADGVSGVRQFGDDIAAKFPASVSALIGERTLHVTTVRFFVPVPRTYETHISLRYQDGFTDMTRLVDGRWPVDLGIPLRQIRFGSDDPEPTEPTVLEAAISSTTATEIGVRVGDRLGVTLDGSDPLVVGVPFKIARTEVEIVGVFEAIDPSAAYWDGDTGLLEVVQAGSADNPVAYATAYVPTEMYPGLYDGGLPFHNVWGFKVDPARVDANEVEQLQVDLRRLGLISGPTPAGARSSVTVLTGLPRILERFAAERALAGSVLTIAAIGPFGLAAGALGMVSILLVRRRRATLALARGRGASGALLLGTQLWEGLLFAGAASLVGLLAAFLAIDARPSLLSPAIAVAVGLGSALLLVGASWPMARRPLGLLDRDDPPVLRVAPRRLVIELTVVVIALGATLLLRQRGLTVTPTDGAASADPLLASVPVLSGLAAGIVALRLYPLPIRALGWLAARRRDFVAVTGLRTIGRSPASANLPLLVLLLTAAFGAFSSVIAASLDRGQIVASYLEVGADFRLQENGIGALSPLLKPAEIPGVEAVAPGMVDPTAAFSRHPSQQATTYLAAVDPRSYAVVTAGTAADPAWPAAFLGDPAGADLGTDANPIPAILSNQLPIGSGDLAPGDTFRMTVNGHQMTFLLIEQRARFPGIGRPVTFAVVPYNWVEAATPAHLLPPSVMWVRGPATVTEPLAAALVASHSDARTASRYVAYGLLHDAPLAAAIPFGYSLALLAAAMYMSLTIIGSLVLSAARRTRDLAYLRTLGVSARQALALTIMEHAPPVLLAVIPGVALGIGVAILCEPGLGLAAFTGTDVAALFVDWPALGVLVAALVGVVAAAVTTGTWLSRRARLVDALRIGDD
ncbi:MAG: FtsX-like permease family protein [Chloroflexota bacterium]